jgi:hypothetical protein
MTRDTGVDEDGKKPRQWSSPGPQMNEGYRMT